MKETFEMETRIPFQLQNFRTSMLRGDLERENPIMQLLNTKRSTETPNYRLHLGVLNARYCAITCSVCARAVFVLLIDEAR